MNIIEKVDVKEDNILKNYPIILEILLKDNTTKKNILWATDNYRKYGKSYGSKSQIKIEQITQKFGQVIKPRVEKTKSEQQSRVRKKAEVFTPSWVCNCQNNLIDNSWFERENVFNTEKDNSWISTTGKIMFSNENGKTWQDYINDIRLEITCGEAPYLVSRYDTVTGNVIKVKDRIGLLDRKLRVVSENVEEEALWVEWALKAFKATYGYEWQGDNLLLARENLLYTFKDYFFEKFAKLPKEETLIEVAKIISWNIWQMDGIKFVIPDSCKKEEERQLSIFTDDLKMKECEGCAKNNHNRHNGIYAKVMNWKTNRQIKFISLTKKRSK